MLTLTAYDTFVEQLFAVMKRFTDALAKAAIEYRLIGGMSVKSTWNPFPVFQRQTGLSRAL